MIPLESQLTQQADYCEGAGAPLYAGLLRAIARALVDRRLSVDLIAPDFEDRGAPWSLVPLRFLGAMHYFALKGDAPELAAMYPSCGGSGELQGMLELVVAAAKRLREPLAEFMRWVPQTNEVGRASLIMAGACEAAATTNLPLRCFEIGASAGLNLPWERYHYRAGAWACGDPDSPVVVESSVAGGTPPTLTFPRVIEHRGCDLHPLDPSNPDDALRLVAYVWPDMRQRLQQLRAALAFACSNPVPVDRCAAAEWINARVRPQAGTTTVLVHSALMLYLVEDERAELERIVNERARGASENAPFATIGFEGVPGHFETRLRLWPHGIDRVVARSDAHGARIEWTSG